MLIAQLDAGTQPNLASSLRITDQKSSCICVYYMYVNLNVLLDMLLKSEPELDLDASPNLAKTSSELACVIDDVYDPQGSVLLVLQTDRPGLIAAVGQELANANLNISFMTVSRTQPGKDAVMAIGVDGQPPQSVLDKIPSISGIKEFALFDIPS